MRAILLPKSTLYTIFLYVSLFYIAIATTCKRAVSKPTTTTIATKPREVPKEKVTADPNKTAADDFSSGKDSLDTPTKGEGEEEREEEENIKKKIEAEFVAEQKRLEKDKEVILLEKESDENLNSNYDVQEHAYDPSYRVEPSAPMHDSFPPDDPKWCNNISTSYHYQVPNQGPTPILSNECNECRGGNNRSFDEEDINDILENPSTKLKIINCRLEMITYKNKIETLFKGRVYIYKLKDKKRKYECTKTDLKKEQETISTNAALCSKHKLLQLEDNIIRIKKINYKIKDVDNIIAKIRKKKNNTSDESTHEERPLYPRQPYSSAPDYSSSDTGQIPPPPYTFQNLYPSLDR